MDGIVHDSRKEAVRWEILKQMESEGKITGLERQKEFLLIPSQYEDVTIGKRKKRKMVERACIYRADFVYQTEDGEIHVEDVKGMRTREYILKRKLMLYVYGVKIEEV
jgi:hypothetical protein